LAFKGINFGILKGDKVALVGQNGSGKTTLMNVLAGVIPADEGTISIRKGITVGYLSQNPVFNESLSVMDSLLMETRQRCKPSRRMKMLCCITTMTI
jgi:ATP-binding cassette subfamily F protein uup